MNVLVACEFSGTVRDAFIKEGHNAWSCDLLPSDVPGPHIQGDVRSRLDDGWDLMIAHPPCTYLTNAGARWHKNNIVERTKALEFVQELLNAPIPKIALENPVGIISTKIRKPDQVIHPWQYGHAEQKRTCLWLKGLPLLQPTNDVRTQMLALPKKDRMRLLYLSPSPTRWKVRSKTYDGIAEAMAKQWGNLP